MIIKINDASHNCLHITHRLQDYSWDGRDNIELLMEMSHCTADALFISNILWGYLADGAEDITDCSEYSVAGDIIDHRDGTVSVRMGKPTAIEIELADAKAALAVLGVTDDDDT